MKTHPPCIRPECPICAGRKARFLRMVAEKATCDCGACRKCNHRARMRRRRKLDQKWQPWTWKTIPLWALCRQVGLRSQPAISSIYDWNSDSLMYAGENLDVFEPGPFNPSLLPPKKHNHA